MSGKKVYNFRDSSDLLEKIDEGTRSNFIRDSIKLKMNIENKNYKEKLIATEELITFYSELLEEVNIEIKKLIKVRASTEKKLNETITRQNTIKTIKKITKEKNTETLHDKRKKILDEIIKNILDCRNNPDNNINYDYLKRKGNYKNIKELKKDLILRIINLREYDTLYDRRIFKEDIEFLKNNMIREY